jgi:hypothetical protein
MNKFGLIVIIIMFFVFSAQRSFAQLGISHEIGVMVGPASFFTDYGERWNIKNNLENAGFGIGLIHYMNFAYRQACHSYVSENFFTEHFKIRSEMDYFYSKLEHFGPVAKQDSEGGRRLRAMHGESQIFQIGAALEYYPLRIRDYNSFAFQFAPYISLGLLYAYYKPEAYSDLGPLTNPNNVFPTFVGGMDFEGGNTWAIAGSVGLRYRLSVVSDLGFEARWQYYDTDWIDGLNINAPQNKYNDFLFWFNIGYIHYLNY